MPIFCRNNIKNTYFTFKCQLQMYFDEFYFSDENVRISKAGIDIPK